MSINLREFCETIPNNLSIQAATCVIWNGFQISECFPYGLSTQDDFATMLDFDFETLCQGIPLDTTNRNNTTQAICGLYRYMELSVNGNNTQEARRTVLSFCVDGTSTNEVSGAICAVKAGFESRTAYFQQGYCANNSGDTTDNTSDTVMKVQGRMVFISTLLGVLLVTCLLQPDVFL